MSWRGRSEAPSPTGAQLKICAGVVEAAREGICRRQVEAAEAALVAAFDDMTLPQREALARAVQANLINRKESPVDLLCFTHRLPIGRKRFYQARRFFCHALLQELGMTAERRGA
ncbi:MAG: hypothetical protein IJF59_03040 [Clostridia bacterium]|nr:hypothetical protein [Clostridia bacterium]MBQ3077602.1 hypothetical protein [Clostridia bacterium]